MLRRNYLMLPLLAAALPGLAGCDNETERSMQRAAQHAEFLVTLTEKDVAEVRQGLPEGAKQLQPLWAGDKKPGDDPQVAQETLIKARNKVQDLRVAKSTFFAVAELDGSVVRSDQQQDLMVGKNIFKAFPSLKEALSKGYAETLGDMEEARGVKGKPDGQWVAAATVQAEGKPVGLYVSGWSWASYARRLHEGLKSHIHDEEQGKKPLIYIFTIVGEQAFGRSEAPLVNSEAIMKLEPQAKVSGDQVFQTELTITGRDFGLAVKRAPALGKDVLIGVLRSEI